MQHVVGLSCPNQITPFGITGVCEAPDCALRSLFYNNSVTAPGVGTFSYTYNLANQITFEDDFTYDLNGNLTADGYTTYTYDAANRLRGVDTGVDATTYQYDGLGNRIGMTHNNVETTYLLDPSGALSQVLRETTGGVNTLYLHGLDIIGQQQGGTWTGFGYDPLGSVRFLLDSSGDLTHALNYDPYGVPYQSNSTTTLGFTGEQTDPNDLVYLRARYYNPRLGAFTSVDPVLGVGGSTGWNGYLYANANPANLTDPSGACIGPLTFLLPVCIGAAKIIMTAAVGATIFGAYDVTANQRIGLIPGIDPFGLYGGRDVSNTVVNQQQTTQAMSTGWYVGATIGLWAATGALSFSLPFKGGSIVKLGEVGFMDMLAKSSSAAFWGTIGADAAYLAGKVLPNFINGKRHWWELFEGTSAFDLASNSFWGGLTNLLSIPLGKAMIAAQIGLKRQLMGYAGLGMGISTVQYLTNWYLTGIRPTETSTGFVTSILGGQYNALSAITRDGAFFWGSLMMNAAWQVGIHGIQNSAPSNNRRISPIPSKTNDSTDEINPVKRFFADWKGVR